MRTANLSQALTLLDKAAYTMEDVKTDKSFRTWALNTIRLCRAYGLNTRVQQMSQLYNKTYPGLRQIIIRPNADTDLDDWLKHVEDKQLAYKTSLNWSTTAASSLKEYVPSRAPSGQSTTHDRDISSAKDAPHHITFCGQLCE